MPFFSNLDHPDSSWVVVTSLPGVLAQFVLFNLVASASVLTLEQKGERRSRACEIERPSIETRKCHFTRLYTVGLFPSSPFACATERSTGNWHGYYHHKSLSDISLPVCYMQDCSFSRFHKIKLYKLQITVYLTVCISSKREDGGGGGLGRLGSRVNANSHSWYPRFFFPWCHSGWRHSSWWMTIFVLFSIPWNSIDKDLTLATYPCLNW